MRAHKLAWQGLAFLTTTVASAQARPGGVAADSAIVVADSAFARAGLGRWLLGSTYRDLWTAPMRVEVLDLGRFAGGLTPLELGGRMQTRSIRFRGADGHEYQFRLVQKHLNPERWKGFEGSLAGGVARDQLSALHPTGALVVPALLEAAGVPHTRPLLRVMPDDPRLGEFREEFANQLGMLEIRVDGTTAGAALMGATRVEDTEDLFEELGENPGVRVDTKMFLTVRLIDLMIGDWDRHEDQYHWALVKSAGTLRWRPIPRDRDYAFSSYDGAAVGLGRKFASNMPVYDEAHGPPGKAAGLGKPLDRRLLNDLPWPVWDSVARRLQAGLTDAVISRAVADLPPEHERLNGAELRRVLQSRRDSLLPAARRFYEYMTQVVRIDGGDTDDWMDAERGADGRTVVRLGRAGERAPYYERTFDAGEAQEIRVFLREGADVARVRGAGPGPMMRVISGEDPDTLVDRSSSQWVRFYDEDDYIAENGERVDPRPYVAPDSNPEIPKYVDWGGSLAPRPRVQHSSHSGLALGVELRLAHFGFRTHPYAGLYTASVEYSFRRSAFRVRGGARWHRENSPVYYGVSGLASRLEGGRFFGFGNATQYAGTTEHFIVRRSAYELSPYVGFGLESPTRLWVMLRARHTVTDMDDPFNRVGGLSVLRPVGIDGAGKLGPVVRFEHDTRNTGMAPTSGIHARVDAEYNPVAWDNGEGPFGAVEGMVATYLSPPGTDRATLALRAGGRQVWGDFPYFEAATVGGSRSLRGFPSGRFSGDRAVYGNAELRLKLLDNRWILPMEIGVLGLADAGRVWFRGASDGSWHNDVGAGIWISILERSEGLTIGFAKGDERRRVWLTLGTPF
jgi:hypothetical protein